MLKIFLLLGTTLITSSIVGIILIIIDKRQLKKFNNLKLADDPCVVFENSEDNGTKELELI